MFVSINWIKDYVDLDGLDVKQLIEGFTLSTAEVEEIIVKGEDVQNVVVGEIISVEEHPNSKKLHLLKVDIGSKVCNIGRHEGRPCACGRQGLRRQDKGRNGRGL